jgi:hypothetical protein
MMGLDVLVGVAPERLEEGTPCGLLGDADDAADGVKE